MKVVLLILVALTLAGCSCDDKDIACIKAEAEKKAQREEARFVDVPSTAATLNFPKQQPQAVIEKPIPPRFSLSRVQIVKDDLAYSRERGVYILKDSQTGTEYIGVSGIGITELGRVGCGKACTKEIEQ
jgi:hypothetical protein